MPDHAVNTQTRPGYSPATATLKPLRYNASGQLSIGDKVTAQRLEDFGISSSDAYEVRIAWRHLHFVDDHDCVTRTYESLARATDDEFKLLLGKILKNAYSDVFNRLGERGIDLDHVARQEWRDIFRDCKYEPANMQSKMITLFRGLCREAIFESNMPQESNQQITETQSQIGDGDKASSTSEGHLPMTESAPALDLKGLSSNRDDSMIEAYMFDAYRYALEVLWLRRKSPGWTEADRASWQKALAANVNLLQTLLDGLVEEKD